ncbi:MAG: LptF/LptG family permease [Paludibacteraceae bacterium]|nr:LptF/LptG family permease [Paludibacteraceae bacterium]
MKFLGQTYSSFGDIDMNPFKRLDRYIIRKFLGTYFLSIVLILSIAVVFDLTEKMDDFYESNAPLKAIIFDYYFNFIPYYMNMFSALFVFISVIFFTSKIAGNSEIIAMLASGISFRRIMWPYFVSATLIFGISFVLGGYVIPKSTAKMLEFENVYIKKFKLEQASDLQMEVEPGVIMGIENYNRRSNRGYRFFLEKYENKTLVSRMLADRIYYDTTQVHRWVVEDYLVRNFDGMRESITVGSRIDTTINVEPEEFFITSQESAQMTNTELRTYLRKQSERGVGNIQAFETELHKRYAAPLAAFIMTLIGVSLSSRKVRGGMGLNLGVGIGLSAVYILFSTISSSFAVSGAMTPFMAVWLPNFIFFAIGAFLYTRTPK